MSFVETVDFIDKEQCSPPVVVSLLLGLGDDFANIFDALQDGREGNEITAGGLSDDSGQGGFTGTRWPPKDCRGELVLLDQASQDALFAEQMLLANHFVDTLRSQALGQWCQSFSGCC